MGQPGLLGPMGRGCVQFSGVRLKNEDIGDSWDLGDLWDAGAYNSQGVSLKSKVQSGLKADN